MKMKMKTQTRAPRVMENLEIHVILKLLSRPGKSWKLLNSSVFHGKLWKMHLITYRKYSANVARCLLCCSFFINEKARRENKWASKWI